MVTVRMYLLICVCCVVAVFTSPASAQSVCFHYTDAVLGVDMEGTPAAACAQIAARFGVVITGREPITVTGCDHTPGSPPVAHFTISGPTETIDWTFTEAGACTAEAPADPASSPVSEPISWSNGNHLMQALLICAFVFVFLNGIQQGNRT